MVRLTGGTSIDLEDKITSGARSWPCALFDRPEDGTKGVLQTAGLSIEKCLRGRIEGDISMLRSYLLLQSNRIDMNERLKSAQGACANEQRLGGAECWGRGLSRLGKLQRAPEEREANHQSTANSNTTLDGVPCEADADLAS